MRSQLKEMVAEAAQALAALEADRLEELALSCQALNQDSSPAIRSALAREARAAEHEMAALAKVLEATRANVAVIERIRNMHKNQLEYAVAPHSELSRPEEAHGVH